ncbi:hypothetical protein NDU88_000228, partial [Pleurodeles waltl]
DMGTKELQSVVVAALHRRIPHCRENHSESCVLQDGVLGSWAALCMKNSWK